MTQELRYIEGVSVQVVRRRSRSDHFLSNCYHRDQEPLKL